MKIAMSDLTGVVNVGSGAQVTIRQLEGTTESLLGREGLVRHRARSNNPTDLPHDYADNRRLVQGTGWSPGYDLASGLRETIDWLKSGVRSR